MIRRRLAAQFLPALIATVLVLALALVAAPAWAAEEEPAPERVISVFKVTGMT